MHPKEGQQWLRLSLLLGLAYFAIGFSFGLFASWTESTQTRVTWNRLAFLTSAVVFVIHIGYEQFRSRNKAQQTAWHTGTAVAFGAFGLALAANIHELGWSAAGYRPRMLVALVAWPLLTGVPAFIVALIAAAGLTLMQRRS